MLGEVAVDDGAQLLVADRCGAHAGHPFELGVAVDVIKQALVGLEVDAGDLEVRGMQSLTALAVGARGDVGADLGREGADAIEMDAAAVGYHLLDGVAQDQQRAYGGSATVQRIDFLHLARDVVVADGLEILDLYVALGILAVASWGIVIDAVFNGHGEVGD